VGRATETTARAEPDPGAPGATRLVFDRPLTLHADERLDVGDPAPDGSRPVRVVHDDACRLLAPDLRARLHAARRP